jgi:8-oxoguanine DNA glycosylase-like protein
MTTSTFNKVHLSEFLKRSPTHAVGRITEVWDGGKQPGSWFAAVGYTSPFVTALSPAKLTRSAVESVVRNERVSDADASMLIFAWGGMTVKNAKSIVCAKNHWLEIVSDLRSEKLTYLEAYDRFRAQSLQGHMPGCSPAYYTKLIFFYTKHRDRRGFIMDQWLGRSINLLADREIVLFNQPRRKTPLKRRYVHKKNDRSSYMQFCDAIRGLAVVSGETDPDVRVREENVEMRLFSEGKGKGKWREYVIANDISR